MLNILIPTDFSENAKKAARYAVAVFGRDCNYTLLNTFEVPHSGTTLLLTISDILEKDSLQLLREEQADLEDMFGLVGKIEVKALMGPPDVIIRKTVNSSPYHMVVMGTKGASGIKGMLMGSVASNTMMNVTCPVMAVPESAELNVPKKIVFAVDDTTLNEGRFPKQLAELAKKFGSEILVLNVIPEGRSKYVGVKDGSTQEPLSVFDSVKHSLHFIENADVNEGIDTFIKDNKVDLLAMITRKDDLFTKLFGTSVTKQMMMHTKTPLLAFH